jgi:hypothetical protein
MLVRTEMGRRSAELLKGLGCSVEFTTYRRMAHSVSDQVTRVWGSGPCAWRAYLFERGRVSCSFPIRVQFFNNAQEIADMKKWIDARLA